MTPSSTPPHSLPDVAWGWRLLRPALYLRLWRFRRLVSGGFYLPDDPDEQTHDGDRILFVGSLEAARFGVVDEQLSTLSQVARDLERRRDRRCDWLFPRNTVRRPRDGFTEDFRSHGDIDAAVVAIGYSDVLLMTTARSWSRELRRLLEGIREGSGTSCPIVLAGLPPMDRFRQTPRIGRKRIRQQVIRLNRASEELAMSMPECFYVPFPEVTGAATQVGPEEFSWASVHRLWSSELTTAVVKGLDARNL